MDNGAILIFVVIFILPPLMFAAGLAVRALTGAVISSVVELSRSRRERSYVRKHQRDMSSL